MPAPEGPSYSSPLILDLEMPDNPEDLDDFNFFDSSIPVEAGTPTPFLTEDLHFDNNSLQLAASTRTPKGEPAKTVPSLQGRQQAFSIQSSASPAESFRDSSSDSSLYNRKTSSDSSRSPLEGKREVLMADMGEWPGSEMMTLGDDAPFGTFDGTINPSSIDNHFAFNDKSMEEDFDFESAASSPSRFGPLTMESPEMPTIKYEQPNKSPFNPKSLATPHTRASPSNSITQSMRGLTTTTSREASPLSTVVTSQESSPSAIFNTSPSPSMAPEFVNGPMFGGSAPNHRWVAGYDYNAGMKYPIQGPNSQQVTNCVPSPLSSSHIPMEFGFRPSLTIHPTPLKSRVETQIPIKMTLFPVPPGITKLHLQAHTISKPKLLAKPPPEKSQDTLELYTMLVCTSAMQNPEYRSKAFSRAAARPRSHSGSPANEAGAVFEEDDDNKPLNGGEVKICPGCITRERKRAARKKVKKVDEEESWHKDEHKRVIVFNTQEVKEWQQPSTQIPSEATGDRAEPMVPDGAMQVDAPMRIACYCRHQHEKLGFQVIFTIKDCNDRLVAQAITSSIMITDDHKTHALPAQAPNCSDPQLYAGSAMFSTEGGGGGYEMPMAPFRTSHSSSDLQNLQTGPPISFHPPMNGSACSIPSRVTSVTKTPRNMSRQASPTGSIGPSSKKRKASGSAKVPSGLAMTRLETSQPSSTLPPSAGVSGVTAASLNLTNIPSTGTFSVAEPQFGMTPSIPAGTSHFSIGPSTPNGNDQALFSAANRSHSMDNLAMSQLYSAPTSAHPSRAPSPTGLRNTAQNYQQQQSHIAVANGFYAMPLSINPHRPPTIHKMIPNEGPKTGGIEVTCLGSGFFQGLEVMFGDTKATTTTYWGETSLVCLLPPAAYAGTVAVTFKHQHHQQQQMQPYPTPPISKQQIFFKYIDDDEQQIIRLALSVLGHKMNGKIEDVRDLARRIVGSDASSTSWGASMGHSPPGGTQHQHISSFSAASFGVDIEATLLRCLDLVDLDDSHHMPRLNLRRPSGQTMLHLACSLGLNRFVAALLARGANPEPRDKGGFTPMHFAAMHDHPQIVRRLILSGADPTMRSLQGYTPADLATSEEVLQSTLRFQYHKRTRSAGSVRSRTSSITSLRSLWEQPSDASSPGQGQLFGDQSTERDDSFDEDDDEEHTDVDVDTAAESAFWAKPHSLSAHAHVPDATASNNASLESPGGHERVSGHVSPSAAMTAFRDQLSTQIAHLQHTMHLNLPNLPNLPQMPTLPIIPNLPDYQAYFPTAPMVRRISSMVPSMGTTSRQDTSDSKEADYRWWDLFSGTVPAAPPAYDEIFPQVEDEQQAKRSSAARAAAEAIADDKCATLFDEQENTSATAVSRTTLLDVVRLGQKHPITREQQEQLRRAHAEKVKRFRSDRNLFFIWIPLLLVIVLAMLYNRVPKVWSQARDLASAVQSCRLGRIV